MCSIRDEGEKSPAIFTEIYGKQLSSEIRKTSESLFFSLSDCIFIFYPCNMMVIIIVTGFLCNQESAVYSHLFAPLRELSTSSNLQAQRVIVLPY